MWGENRAAEEEVGGYDCEFVEEPSNSLKCVICLLVAKDPQQHNGCGKLFCKSCITRYKFQRNDCPHCRQSLFDTRGHKTMFYDLKSDQEIKSLKLLCTLQCGWKGELGALDEHKKKHCENAAVPCPLDCGTMIQRKALPQHQECECPRRAWPCELCGEINEYRSLNSHLQKKCPKREYHCLHCNEVGCYDERTTKHLEVCPKVEIRCPKCSIKVSRSAFPMHPKTCTHERVPCKYLEIGCNEKPLRKSLRVHEKEAQLHLVLAKNKVLELTKKLLLKNTVTFKMTSFADKRAENDEFISHSFLTSKLGYKMCVRIITNGEGTHVSVAAHLMKGDNDDSLTWPFTGTVTFELLNQLEDRNHHKKSITFPAESEASKRVVDGEKGTGWGYPKFISHTELDNQPDKNCQYLKDDTLIFRVSVQVPDHKPWLECDN